jgi:hypothetical protein
MIADAPTIFDSEQCCPRCDGAIAREHFVRELLVNHLVTYLYCDHCDYGIETLWLITGGPPREQFSLQYDRSTDPRGLRRFLSEMEVRRVA